MVPSAWRRRLQDRLVIADADSDAGFDSDDGEELGDVDESILESYEQSHHSAGDTRRLSRDLEEGFRDDSDDEFEGTRRAR